MKLINFGALIAGPRSIEHEPDGAVLASYADCGGWGLHLFRGECARGCGGEGTRGVDAVSGLCRAVGVGCWFFDGVGRIRGVEGKSRDLVCVGLLVERDADVDEGLKRV